MSPDVPEKKDTHLALLLALGRGVVAAAEETRLSRKTVQRRLANPRFRRLVAELRAQMVAAALGKMTAAMANAADIVAELLRHDDVRIRLRAARLLLTATTRLRDSVDVADRLNELERELDREQEGRP